MKSKIKPTDTIAQVMAKYPETTEILEKKFNMMCLHCPMSTMETIGDGARAHGIETKEFIEELNKSITKSE